MSVSIEYAALNLGPVKVDEEDYVVKLAYGHPDYKTWNNQFDKDDNSSS